MVRNSANRKLWAYWTLYCGLGEFLGIAAAAAIAVLFNNLVGEPTTSASIILLFAAAILSGTIEGSITGSLQARVLKGAFSVDFKRWVLLTIVVAVIGWIGGTIPVVVIANASSAGTTTVEPSLLQISGYALLLGLVAGALFGFAQWFELRRHVQKAGRWVVANALAWSLAMVLIFFGATWPSADTPILYIIISGFVVGLLGGLVLGAITGLWLIRFEKKQ